MDWAVKHWRPLALGVVPVLVVLAGYFVWRKVEQSQRGSRLEALGKVQVVFEDEERKANDQREAIQKQIEDLDKKLAPPPAATKPGETAPPPAQPDPKLAADKAALEKQAEGIKANHAESLKQFQDFYKKNEKTPEGWLAGMTAAKLLIDDQKITEAQPILESVVDASKAYPLYQTQGRLALSGVYEEQGNYDKALAELDVLEKSVSADVLPKVLLARGRIQLLKSQKAEAKATFDGLIEKHGASPEAQKARSLQALLN
jgi:predicted negative regulator of RcsB-dependent stress response